MTDPDYGVRPCCVPDCSRLLPRNRELPVCHDCGVKIAVAHLNDATRLHPVQAEARRLAEQRRERVHAGRTRTACVYYVELGPNRIKIGFTSDLRQRLRDLRTHPTNLLAIEPGGRELEGQRHRLFAADRIASQREEFVHSTALARHIQVLRELHELPPWSQVPDTKTVSRRQA